MRENKNNPLPPGELTEAEYFEQIVRPNKERSRQRLLYIESVRTRNARRARAAERRRKAGRSLFEIYSEEPGGLKLFDD